MLYHKCLRDISLFENLPISSSFHKNLLVHYSFDPNKISGTTVIDSTNNNNHGTINGSYSLITGKRSTGINFPTSNNSYVSMPSVGVGLSKGAFSFWIQRKSGSQSSYLWTLDAGAGAGDMFRLDLNYNGILSVILNGQSIASTNSSIGAIDSWNHVIVQSDGTNPQIFVNSFPVGISSANSGWIGSVSPTVTNTILRGGYGSSGFNNNASVYLDEFKMFDRPLTQDEVNEIYNDLPSILSADYPSLVSYYTFDDLDGFIIKDSSTRVNEASIITNATVSTGIDGNALEFPTEDNSGSQHGINLGSHTTNLTRGAISVWLKPLIWRNSRNISLYTNGAVSSGKWFNIMRNYNGALQITAQNESNTQITHTSPTNLIPAYTWNHLIAQYDGTNYYMWVNGTKYGPYSGIGWMNLGSFAEAWAIRGLLNPTFGYYQSHSDCVIDHYRIFDDTVTDSQATELANEFN